MTNQHHLQGATAYMAAVRERLDAIAQSQSDGIDRAANTIVKAIRAGGQIYLFGTGHSHMLAEEGHYRAGGLAAVCPVLSSSLMLHEGAVASTQLERTSGLGPAVLSRYQPAPPDVLVIFSNSGVNAVPVETAAAAKDLGLSVIAVVACDYAAQATAGPTGQKLTDLADIVLDNQGVPGDALVSLGDSDLRVGPLSTIAGAFLLNATLTEVAWRIYADGEMPPIYISANMPGAQAHNDTLVETYRLRNPHL
ncbi:SIS domain-containing protein [Aggregatilinea lenta]|uniref:SIS domain-containing protein n=1 Tax=Aggregatilinea lenta TaxID=913108 RepID=UPI001EE8E0CB|nr:SIS domain-containing protein [Aggregatilinea lenta]